MNDNNLARYRLWPSAIAGLLLILDYIFLSIFNIRIIHRMEILILLILLAPVFYNAVIEFKENPFSIDTLMVIASVSATLLGAIHEAILILILFNLSEYLEEKTTDKLRNAAYEISKMIPKKVLKIENGRILETDVEKLDIGDIILVKLGQRIPVDGEVILGESSIDVSTLTGEPIPIDVSPGSKVLSGSINLTNSIHIRVLKPFKDSTISRIIKLVVESHERKAKIERFIDRFSSIYTPIVVILATLTVVIPVLIFSMPLKVWAYRALILLVLACPSAFIISTPITYFVGLVRAMKSGIIVKGSIYLETLSNVKAMAFDKTGTLTKNKLVVSRIVTLNNFDEKEILKIAATLESHSNHPIALAIVEKAKKENIDFPSEITVKEIPGMGLKALIPNMGEAIVGSLKMMEVNDVKIDNKVRKILENLRKAILVALNKRLIGIIELEDEIKESAINLADKLRSIGIRHIIMITGDHEKAAKEIAEKVGITEFYANLLPEEKVKIVEELKKKYEVVSMVGDGINDAPALAVSDVGIAMGTAGNDIAIESADVAIMSDDLRRIPYLIKLSKKVQRTLKINLIFTFFMKIILMLLGFLGLIPLFVAVLGDDGLTLVVIANTIPILKYLEETS